MKLLLKILAAPVIAALTLFVWICSAILYCSAYVLGLAGSLLGLPMAAAWLLARVQDVKYAIIDTLC